MTSGIKKVTYTALGSALLLLGLSLYIERNPGVLGWGYFELVERCTFGENICHTLVSPFRILVDTEYEIRRAKISKVDLPILRIYLTDGALEKLDKKAETKYLLKTDDDWVNAKILVDDGMRERMVSVTLRLKGDLNDHFFDSRRWMKKEKRSFRIKTKANQLILGMTKFSIQDPNTRNNQSEALILSMMRRIGVLSPRYFFVDVRINNQKVGVMALEEHFSKELVESQSRREGPIVAFDEDWFWQQIALNDARGAYAESNLVLRDYPVKAFRSGSFQPGTASGEQKMRAVSLLRDYVDGRIPGMRVFDLDLLSRWWIMANITGSTHGMQWKDQRFFFDPISERLEPISYDNMNSVHQINPLRSTYVDFSVSSVVNIPEFRKFTRENITRIGEMLRSEEFQNWFSLEQQKYLQILSLDNIYSRKISVENWVVNLSEFTTQIEQVFSAVSTTQLTLDIPVSKTQWSMLRLQEDERGTTLPGDNIVDPNHGRLLMANGASLYTHIRPFWFWSDEDTTIEIKNLTLDPIIVRSVFFSRFPEKNLAPADTNIPVYRKGSAKHIFSTRIDLSNFNLDDEMWIQYSYRNQEYTKPVVLQFRNFESEYGNQEITKAWLEKNRILQNPVTKTITFPAGAYSLERSLEIKNGWQVTFSPGTILEFKRGARLRVNGPVYAMGRENLPVTFFIESNPSRGRLGSWGGLLIVQAGRHSILRHTQVFGSVKSGLATRQDSLGLTGCVTFFKSNVRIEYSTFHALQCEDALNIISSEFEIDHLEIADSNGDAFDSDFSNGIITDSSFVDIVNDGIDVSGSRVEILSSRFLDIQDKAISVGETSRLTAHGLTITGANIGVVSKDNSITKLRDSLFENIDGSALMAYVKKEEYGPSEIHCDNCRFVNVESIAAKQFACRMTINGKEVSTVPFSRKQLRIAGYIQ